jgi:hypothetical protein
MNKLKLYRMLLLGIAFFFSCKEESKNETTQTKMFQLNTDSILIAHQPYFSLLFSLDMNDEILISKKVKSYTASFFTLEKTPRNFKLIYKNIQPNLNEITLADIQLKKNQLDTINAKKIVTISSSEKIYSQRIAGSNKNNSKYSLIEKFNASNQLIEVIRNNEITKKIDNETFSYNGKNIIEKKFSSIGKMIFNYNANKKLENEIFINEKGDTNMAYRQTIKDNHILINYFKVSREVFDYTYNEQHELLDIMWKENNKMKVHLVFSYYPNHLVKTRMIMSNVKAFPSCKTEYVYNFK